MGETQKKTETSVPPVIGVVGGIGSGKSFFTNTLAHVKNVAIVNGDAIGHEVLKLPEIQRKLVDRFGGSILAVDGAINRKVLAGFVFGSDPEHVRAKADLEAIVHPPLHAELRRRISEARDSRQHSAIILDAAILLEAGWRSECDRVVYLNVPWDVRLQRVRATRGWRAEDLRAREASQWSQDAKKAAADYILDNFGPPEVVQERILHLFDRIMDEAASAQSAPSASPTSQSSSPCESTSAVSGKA